MATPEDNETLSTETAQALLNAIKDSAPGARQTSHEALESLAKAYATIVDAMPRPGGSG